MKGELAGIVTGAPAMMALACILICIPVARPDDTAQKMIDALFVFTGPVPVISRESDRRCASEPQLRCVLGGEGLLGFPFLPGLTSIFL